MKIGFIASAFDLLHPGHLALLASASKRCDHLVVGLHINPQMEREWKNKPIETAYERYIRLDACKYVDEIFPYETEEDLYNFLVTRKIDIRFLGSDYEGKSFTGDKLPIEVVLLPREHNWSSTNLRKRICK